MNDSGTTTDAPDEGPTARSTARPWAPLADALWIAAMGGAGLLVWWLADLGPFWRLGSVALELGIALLLLLIAHELLHMLMAWLSGVPLSGIGLRVGWRLLHVTVTRRPGPRAWQATALAPSLVLSVALLVPLLRSGDPFWLALLVVHVASCRVDWQFAREALGPPRPDDLPDSRVPGLATLVLAIGLAVLLPTLPASTWLRADQVVCLVGKRAASAPPGRGPGAQAAWRFRADGARALVLTWTTRQGTAVEATVEHTLTLSRAHGTLAVRFDPGAAAPARPCLWVALDDDAPQRIELGEAAGLPAGASMYSLEPAPLRTDQDVLLVTRLRAAAGDVGQGEFTPDQLAGCATLTLRIAAGD